MNEICPLCGLYLKVLNETLPFICFRSYAPTKMPISVINKTLVLFWAIIAQ